jgi:polyisoprenyl-teichoic acid--peptidoglycan teichoic acid transferase
VTGEPAPPSEAPELPPPAGPPAFTVLAFWSFILGGLIFGALFVFNWKAMSERPQVVVAAAVSSAVSTAVNSAGIVPVPRPQVAMPPLPPIGMPRPGQQAEPSLPAAIGTNIAAAARVLLPEWSGTERINIVLLGIDKREDEPIGGTRSDTIMLASIDPVGKSVALVSLPRDLWVNIPGYGQQRINVAHAVGGPDLTKRTITADFGINVQYYARVDFRGFEQLIDTMGGVILDVDRPIKDDAYPTENYGYQRIYIGPGPQWMGGQKALQYARSRHSDNDFGRARRQQKVLVAVRDRALQLNMLPKAPEVLGIVQRSLSTDLTTAQLLALARLGSEIDREKIVNLVVDTEYAEPFRGADGADLLRPNTPAIRRAIDSALKSAGRPELRARIEVVNGTPRRGLGQQAADYLQAQGFKVVSVAAAERTDYRSSLVQVLTDDRRAAEALASMLKVPTSAITVVPTANAQVDIRIVIGQDFLLPGG